MQVYQSPEDFYRRQPVGSVTVPATSGPAMVMINNIPDGPCLVTTTHDVNDDGRLNSNVFGTPTEPSAFYTPAGHEGMSGPRHSFFELGRTNRRLDVILGPAPADPRSWGAGVMAFLSSNPYRDGGMVVRVFPSLTYTSERFYIVGPRAGANLFKNRWISLNLAADYRFTGDAFEDEPALAGMEKRSDSLMGGLEMSLRNIGKWRINSSIQTDLLGRHDGQEFMCSLGRHFRNGRWSLTPTAGLVWRSSTYNDYYFGVREQEVRADRPAYHPGASAEWFARVLARVEVTGSWSLLASTKLELLSGEVRDSPIVDKKVLTSTYLGVNYAF